jgi:hypothetical protein
MTDLLPGGRAAAGVALGDMHRSPPAVLVALLGVLVIFSVHLVGHDNASHLMSGTAMVSTEMGHSSGMAVGHDRAMPTSAPGEGLQHLPANDHRGPHSTAMETICQLLVLAMVVGALPRRCLARLGHLPSDDVGRLHWVVPVWPKSPEPRPPGLAVLCVARC